VRSAKKDTGFSMRNDRRARSGSGDSGLAKRWLTLVLFPILVLLSGCVSQGFGGSSSVASHDAVDRIVASGRLRVGTSGVQPPLSMKDREGNLVGLDVDLARALADAMKLELVLIERPFAELLDGLGRDEYDLVISSLTITPARNARVAFAGPYLISGATFLTRKELVEELDQHSALDAPERTLGALAGSTSEALIREAFPKAKRYTTDDLSLLIPKVQSGELDGFFSDLPYVRFVLARNPDAGLAELSSSFTTEPIGIALSPGSPLLANLVQNYLNTLEYTGLLMQMKAYWLTGGEWLGEIDK
jgi:ABC-type amino acid transport substrate-binding protein